MSYVQVQGKNFPRITSFSCHDNTVICYHCSYFANEEILGSTSLNTSTSAPRVGHPVSCIKSQPTVCIECGKFYLHVGYNGLPPRDI